MTNTDIERSITEVGRAFPQDSLEASVCGYVFQLFQDLGDQFDSISLGTVLRAMKWRPDSAHKRAISTALDFLTLGNTGIFERRYELWPPADEDSEVLAQPLCELSHDDIREALEKNQLICPVTGEIVSDYQDRITVLYVVTESAKKCIGQRIADR